eukprot:41171-Rhodomonas_salina.2
MFRSWSRATSLFAHHPRTGPHSIPSPSLPSSRPESTEWPELIKSVLDCFLHRVVVGRDDRTMMLHVVPGMVQAVPCCRNLLASASQHNTTTQHNNTTQHNTTTQHNSTSDGRNRAQQNISEHVTSQHNEHTSPTTFETQ